jgi:hypothetical protein
MLEIIQTHYGRSAYPEGLYVTDTNDPHKYVMAVRTDETTYYEASDDLDELYEQAGTILSDNVMEWQVNIAVPLVIVETTTGKIMEPWTPMVQFREMAGTIQDWSTDF